MRSARLLVLALGALLAGVLLVGRPAGAVGNPDYTVPPPATVVTTPTPQATTEVEVVTAVKARPVRTRLALTGSDATTAAVAGAAMVAAGGAIMLVRRRRMVTT